jgi:cbb3-type cytochrome oxidase subunit 3
MRLVYNAHIPFVVLFLLFVAGMLYFHWKGRRSQ